MASKTIATVLTLKDNMSAPLKNISDEMKQMRRQAQASVNQINKFATSANNAFLGASKAAAKFVAGTAILGGGLMAKQGLQLASDLQEVQNVVNTTFGSGSAINDWSKETAKRFGVSELQAKQFSGTLGAMMKSSGVGGEELQKMSMNLSGLSGDFASFYNTDPQQAFDDLKSAMAGGTETMLKYGVNMQVAAMQEYAHSKGIKKKWDQLSQLEKTQLRYNYIMEKTKDAQGDFEKTSQSYANQMRILKLNMADMAMNIMNNVLPSVNKFVIKLNEHRPQIEAFAKKTFEGLGKAVGFVKDNFNWIAPVMAGTLATFAAFNIITTVVSAYKALKTAVFITTLAQQGFNVALKANPIGLAAAAVGLLVAGLIPLIQHWDEVKKAIDGAIKSIREFLGLKENENYGGTPTGNGTVIHDKFAKGGYATKPSLCGEAGPEFVIPDNGSPRSKRLLAEANAKLGGGSGVVVNVASMVVREEADIDKVADRLFYKIKQAAFNM